MFKQIILLLLLIWETQANQPLRSPCPRAIKINTNYQWRNSLHFICLQNLPNRGPQLDIIEYASQRNVVSIRINELDTNQLASFVDGEGTLRVLVAVPGRINGTSVYSFDSNGNPLSETFTINTQLVSTMSIWKLELNWEWQLATANHPYVDVKLLQDSTRNARQPLPDLRPMITIHSWRLTYFDRYETIILPFDGRVNKLEPMHINDQEFLIVAMESQAPMLKHYQQPQQAHQQSGSALRTDSLIFKLDFGDGSLKWVTYQYLATKHALDASSFVITHKGSLQRDYYIALVGQSEPDQDQAGVSFGGGNGGGEPPMSNEHGLIIYKYLGDQFMKIHSFAVPEASKLDTISYGSGDSYVVIAVLSGWSKQISLFLFDGLYLTLQPPTRPLHSSNPLQARPLNFESMNSESLHLFRLPRTLAETSTGLGSSNKTTNDSISADDSSSESSNNIHAKRTLGDESAGGEDMLALAFSTMSDTARTSGDAEGADQEASASDTLFQIPINALIENSTAQTDEGRGKRDQIGPNLGQDLFGWCKSQIDRILSDNFDSTTRQLAALPRVDQRRPIELTGDLIIEGDLHVSNLLYANKIVDIEVPEVVVDHVPMNYTETFNRIEQAHSVIDSIKHRVDQILVDDGTIQEVYTPLRFQHIVFDCLNPSHIQSSFHPGPLLHDPLTCPQVGEIRTDLLNSRDINNLQQQAFLTGRSMKLIHDVRFEHLVLRGKTSILDTLNGIRVDDIVFRQGQLIGPITGRKNFLNGLYSTADLHVASWNGAQVDRQNYLTSSGEQRINADLRFQYVVVDVDSRNPSVRNASSRIEQINGLHLDVHLSQIAQKDRPNSFEVPLAFDELIIQGPTHIAAKALLASIDIEEFWYSAMFKHSHQNVSAPMHFVGDVHVSYGGDIIVDGPVNGVVLRPDNVMMRNRNYDLPNRIVFDGNVDVRLLQVEKALNGIQVVPGSDGRPELAILYDGGVQTLTGDKIFGDVRLGGLTNISGVINGHLNLTQLSSLVSNQGRPFRFKGVHLKGNNIQIGDNVEVRVSSSINGVQANAICSLANKLAQSPPTVVSEYNRLKFEDPIEFKSKLYCASINGFNNLANSFLMKHGNQHVSGTLRLLNGVVFNSTLNIASTFNNLNVSSMSHAINQTIRESQTGHKDFYGDLYIDDLSARAINDLPLDQVFVANSDSVQTVSAPMTFDHLDIENVLVVGRDLQTGSFNGLNVTDIIANTLQYDAPQVVYNHVELDHLHILPGANLVTKSLNGHDLRQVYSDSVLIDVPQQILAPKTFNGHVSFNDRVFLKFGLDGLSENELRHNLLLHSDELIENDVEFNNDVTVMKSLEVQTGLINDVDVDAFVNSMLHENRPNGLRVLSNSTLRFKDVKVNDLVVTGTIQGLDLSKEALLRDENSNGTYNDNIRSQQILTNNQRIFEHLYQSRPTFRVQTNHHNETFAGACHIHSCPQTTPIMTSVSPPAPMPAPMALVNNRPPPPTPQPQPMPPAQQQIIRPIWRPIEQPIYPIQMMNQNFNNNYLPRINTTVSASEKFEAGDPFGLVDPKFLEYQAMLKAEAIKDLMPRVNKYLSYSFYYEIVHNPHNLGPVLHAASNPIPNEEGRPWLLLKAVSKKGEPCLQRGQKIEIISQQRHRDRYPTYTISSRIQETSNPSLVDSLVVDQSHYVFVVDVNPEDATSETVSHVLVYLWDYKSGMYDKKHRIIVDGFPTAMKAFALGRIACIALADPTVEQNNQTGEPILYCQQMPMSDFNQRQTVPMYNIFDLDIVTIPSTNQIIIAALARRHSELVGDMMVAKFDVVSRSLVNIAMRRTVRPLKLHFIKQLSNHLQLVVSEGITSNDAVLATTRVFSIHSYSRVIEKQIIKDNQFTDIQSVMLDSMHSMVFFKSFNTISIYAPIGPGSDCELTLIQQLPLRGANKFLVFGDGLVGRRNATAALYGHTLVLSKDDCEHQQFSTLILKPKFV